MLDLLTFIWEKLFLLAHLKLFSHLAAGPERHETREARQCERDRTGAPRYQRGDLLEVPRTLFVHFGIYLGENRVAHLIPDILPVLTSDTRHTQVMVTNTRLLLGVLSKNASVRVDSVEDFAYGGHVLINAMDKTLQKHALESEQVARRAEELVGAVPYSLMWNNCEHFVTDCRYGTAVSLQTDQVASVRVDKVEHFANGSQIIVNHTDKLVGRSPLRGEEVARRAEKLLGPADFSLLWWNCEHFVMYCRFASSMSFQSAQFCLKARKYLLRRASACLSAAMGLFLIFYLDVVSLLSIFIIFIISINVWMAV